MFTLKYYKGYLPFQGPLPTRAGNPGDFDIADLAPKTLAQKIKGNLLRVLAQPVFAVLRAVWPNPCFGRLQLVTRAADVREVLSKTDAFSVPFGPEMLALGGGFPFLLGEEGPDHDAQRALIKDVLRRDDMPAILGQTKFLAEALVASSKGRIDVMRDFIICIAAETCITYFGLKVQDRDALADWSLAVSNLLFADWGGDATSHNLAMAGAARMGVVIDRAIAHAHAFPGGPAVVDRLVNHASKPSDGQVRAIMMGLVTGFIPTTTLAAGNILLELLKRPDAMKGAMALARAQRRAELKSLLHEAARLNPALLLGQLRYAVKDGQIAAGTWRAKKIEKDTVILVATASALRDRRVFPSPNSFVDGRDPKPDLMFGDGAHECMGSHLAMEQITELFMVLLAQPKLRKSKKRDGQLAWIGPFASRLDMEFDPPVAPIQTSVVCAVPIRDGIALEDLQALIARETACANSCGKDMAEALRRAGIAHFASLSAVDVGDPAKPDARLILELQVDGPGDAAIDIVAREAAGWLKPIFACARDVLPLEELLKKYAIHLTGWPWGATGLNFKGTDGFSVTDIARQSELAAFARDAVDDYLKDNIGKRVRALDVLDHVRELIGKERTCTGTATPHAEPASRLAKRVELVRRGKDFTDLLVVPGRQRLGFCDWVQPGYGQMLANFTASRSGLSIVAVVAAIMAGAFSWIFYSLVPTLSILSDGAIQLGVWLEVFATAWLIFKLRKAARLLLPSAVVAIVGILLWDWHQAHTAWLEIVYGALVILTVAAWPLLGLMTQRFMGARIAVPLAAFFVAVALAERAIVRLDSNDHAVQATTNLEGHILLAGAGAVAIALIAVALVLGVFVLILRLHEMSDAVDDRPPDLDSLRAIARHEDRPGYAQNHIIAITPLKTGRFRRLTLSAALWGVKQTLAFMFRPGFVSDMGTIHFAQWCLIPGTGTLLFLANYNGSWESYLEDFITKVHPGQSAAWSNAQGFPRTSFLVFGGAEDGDRFKRWVRRQQKIASFWFSRFPELTTDHIRANAVIRDGLARATTETDARAWLNCFGSMQRRDLTIETDEVQSLVFRGMKEFPHIAYVIARLPAKPNDCKAWLREVQRDKKTPGMIPPDTRVTFGDRSFNADAAAPGESSESTQDGATFVAFSAVGLKKFGMPSGDPGGGLSTFPGAFNLAMANRGDVLGDFGESRPSGWDWSDDAPTSGVVADAMIFVYGRTPAARERHCEYHKALLRQFGGDGGEIEGDPAPLGPNYENFGFRDGISQPVIRGTQRFAKHAPQRDIVEPGEFIIGYRNNQGDFSPSIVVRAETDFLNDLPAESAETPQPFPNFVSDTIQASSRDFGRNGCFLAIRQLAQDVEGFHRFTSAKASQIAKDYPLLSNVTGAPVDRDWLEAKMVGRWHDGTPLVDRSYQIPAACPMPAHSGRPHNDFGYAAEDPTGMACPLGAHIRRANPRDGLDPDDPREQSITNRHRLLRRGRAYQKADGAGSVVERGLMFVCLCSNLERQFEFVQQTWVGAPFFQGLKNEPDPLTGAGRSGAPVYTIPTASGPVTVTGIESFVTVKGGGYFFLPSRSALQYLADSV